MISLSPGCCSATSRDLGQEAAGEQRQGQPGALGRRPQPVDRAVGRPGLLVRLQEDEAQAEHPRPLLPAVDQPAALGLVEREVAEDRQAVGMLACRLDRQLVGVRIPGRRRVDHRGVDAGLVHLLQQIVLGEGGDLTVIGVRGLAATPDVDLRIDDAHQRAPTGRTAGSAGSPPTVVRCMRRLWRVVSNGVARWSTQRLSQIDQVALAATRGGSRTPAWVTWSSRAPAAARGPPRPASPSTCEAWAPRKRVLRPLTGFVRTSGWRTGGYSARSLSVKKPGRTWSRDHAKSWTTTARLDAALQRRSGSEGYAARALANSVAPPSGGTMRAESSEQSDGHRLERAVAVPEHVGELVDHPPVVGRDDLARLDVEVRLAREGRARGRVHAARDLQRAEAAC